MKYKSIKIQLIKKIGLDINEFFSNKKNQIEYVNRGGYGSNIWVFGCIRVDSICNHTNIRCFKYLKNLEF